MVMVLTMTASIAVAQGFEDELYGGSKKKKRLSEEVFSTKSSSESKPTATATTSNQGGIIASEMNRGNANVDKEESDKVEGYYPGMFEDAVNGRIDNAYDARKKERNEDDDESNVYVVFASTWAPSWYTPWGAGFHSPWAFGSYWGFYNPYDPFYYYGCGSAWAYSGWGWHGYYPYYPYYGRYNIFWNPYHYNPYYGHHHHHHHSHYKKSRYSDRSVVHSSRGVIKAGADAVSRSSYSSSSNPYRTNNTSINNRLQAPRGNSYNNTTRSNSSIRTNSTNSNRGQYNRTGVTNSSSRSNSNSSYNRSNSTTKSSSNSSNNNSSSRSNSSNSSRSTSTAGGRR